MSKTSRREKGKNVYFFFLMFRWQKKKGKKKYKKEKCRKRENVFSCTHMKKNFKKLKIKKNLWI